MIAAIRHRGPDAQGEYADGPLWLGHARLSILDLSDCARQPMSASSKPLFFDHLETFERERPGVLNTAFIHSTYAASNGRVDCSYRLWRLLNFMIWCNSPGVEVPACSTFQ